MGFMTDSAPEVIVHLPPVTDDQISRDLRRLTEVLETHHGADSHGGGLGGTYGYATEFENEVFQLHPYCWCERADCPWCLSCECGDDAYRYFRADGTEVTAEAFWDAGGYTMGDTTDVLEKRCINCREHRQAAPNFLHKPSGSRVCWYKYLGRGMEVELQVDWTELFTQCLASLGATPAGGAS